LKINLGAERRELDRMAQIVNVGSISINDFEKTKDRVHALEVQVENGAHQNKLTIENHVFELRTKVLFINQQDLLVADLHVTLQMLNGKCHILKKCCTIMLNLLVSTHMLGR